MELRCRRRAGALFMQMAVPQLRAGQAARNFNTELASSNYNLNDWR